MLDERGYRLLVAALRSTEVIDDLRTTSAEPFPVVLMVPQRGPLTTELSALALASMWHELTIQALSLEVSVRERTRRACVVRCANGQIEEALCSETADDMAICFEVTTQRCGSGGGGTERATFIPPLVNYVERQRERA